MLQSIRRRFVHTAAAVKPRLTRNEARARLDAIDREGTTPSPALVDQFQRHHTYLRISLTERCNLRCTYCMPEDGVALSPYDQLLSTDEIVRLARLFVREGVTKIRLTGGEPTLRKDLVSIIAQLNELRAAGLKSIAMTTNGITLKHSLQRLVDAGLDTVNISLDTLDPHLFEIMTRRRGLQKVIDSIDLALQSQQIRDVKVNCVVMRPVNDHECTDFVEFIRDRPITVRFIEYMPFDGNKWQDRKMVPYTELLARIEQQFGGVQRISTDIHDTSKIYAIPGIRGRVGFITSMSDHFCGGCNRLRITADGHLKVCLFGNNEVSLRDCMRQGLSDDDLLPVIEAAVKKKRFAHAGMTQLSQMKNRPMILIGG